jgi:hypothetical protein
MITDAHAAALDWASRALSDELPEEEASSITRSRKTGRLSKCSL